MAGAERHRRLDPQRHRARRDLVRIMRAMHEEPPGGDRRQIAPDLRHPVGFQQFRDGEIGRPMRRRQQRQRDAVGRGVEIGADLPAAAVILDLETANGKRCGVERLDRLGKRARGVFAGQGRQGGPCGHGGGG